MSSNTVRISFTSFFAYSVIAAMISPLGIVSKPIAEHYDVSLTAATATFTYLALGNLFGCLMAIYIFDYVRFKSLIVGGAILIGSSICAMYVVDSFSLLPIWLTVTGTCCGLGLSAAAVVITETYKEKMRAPMLLLTDSFYSMAAALSTFLAGFLMARQLHFSSAYALAFAIAAAIAILAIFSQYPIGVDPDSDRAPQRINIRDRPLSIHMISAAIFMYLIGFVTVYSWVPNYAQASLGASVEISGLLVSRFFVGLFIGQLITFFIVLKFPVRTILVIYTCMATLTTIGLWNLGSIDFLQINMFALGLIAGGIFKVMLSYATTTVDNSDAKLVSYLIFSSAFGTAVAPAISSFVVENTSMVGALQFVTFCYAVTCALFLYSLVLNKKERPVQLLS